MLPSMPSHLRRHDESGHIHFWTISCFQRLSFFHDDGMKQIVVDGLRVLQNRFGVCLISYVVMPDHVHVILLPQRRGEAEPIKISSLLAAFKKHVGFHGKERLRDVWRRDRHLWSEPLNNWALGVHGERPIWIPRAYDSNIDRAETLRKAMDYCHCNPLTRGFVQRVDDWAWSSHRFYQFDDRSMLAMDWDGSWPIIW
jgi:putative transposase